MPVRKVSFGLSVALVCSILYLALHFITNSIYNAIKQPYMDEIFHVPQTQRYCQGNITYYDPKLTTPPGLYLITYLRIWIRDKILLQREELVCDTIDLRRTNHLIAIFNLITVVLIQLTSNGGPRGRIDRKHGFEQRIVYMFDHSNTSDLAKILLTSISITLLPPLFFFNSLYYTDAGSLLFILLTYLFATTEWHLTASIFGLISILFRQTNIVWVFYVAYRVMLGTFEEYHVTPVDQQQQGSSVSRCYHNFLYNKKLILNLIKRGLPYATVGLLFIAFVVINKGIVLGDKEAHQPRLHFAQILYFLGFYAFFGAIWIFNLRLLKRFLYFIIRSPLIAIILSTLIMYTISFGRYAHPYLLADNRHLTFYIWRRILDRHNSYVPYLLTPIYLVSSLSVWHHFRDKGCKQMLLFAFCTMLVTVPNGLLEPRYFIIPFVILRLNIETNLLSLLLEIGQHVAVNIGMYYLFLHKTFHWTDSPEVQRIMW